MKKIYESPKSLTVVIQAHGRLLQNISGIGGGGEGMAREQKDNWDDNWDDTDN